MTTPGNQPWPPVPPPSIPPPPSGRKRLKPLQIVGIAIAGGLVLCCGGLGTIGAVFGDDPPGAAKDATSSTVAADEQTVAPRLAAPIVTTTSPAPTTTTAAPPPTKAAAAARATPARTTAKPAPARTTAKPKPRPTTKKPTPRPTKTRSPVRQGVHPGAFCSPAGALGLSTTGKPMICRSTATDERNRWRAR